MYIKLLATLYEMVYIHHTHQAHEVAPCSAKVWIAAPTSDLASQTHRKGEVEATRQTIGFMVQNINK
jgi:HAMP domain-containing protein